MADKPEAPQNTQPGSLWEAQETLLNMMEPEKETPEVEEVEPTEEEESVDESSEEVSEDVSEEGEESPEEESEEESDEVEVEEEPDVYSVKVDGEEQEVSLDELIKGYSRQSDYTRKTQELAGERSKMTELQQQWANEVIQAQAERQQYIDALGQFVQNSMAGLEQFGNIDWETLREEDPIAFVTKKEEFRDAQERIQQAQVEQQNAHQRQAEELKKVKSMALQEEHKRLVAAVPEWGEPEKRQKLTGDLSSYALEQGFSREELAELIDHRSLIVLMKAQKYDALQKSDVKAKKIKNKPKVVRSGKGIQKNAQQKTKRTAQMKRLQASGKAEDAATLLEDFVQL